MIAPRPTSPSGSRPIRSRILIGLSALAAICVAAPEASAQSGYYASRVFYDELERLIPPRAVVYRLQDRGFTEIARPRFDGTAYIVDATNPAGIRTRLFVDARDGGVIGRQRLDAPYFPSGRPNRPAPGYGWTEQDVAPGRNARAPDGLIPPADIPNVAPQKHRAPRSVANFGAEMPGRPGVAVDANPSGLNPEGKARPTAAPRKSARLTQPARPSAPSAATAAPTPKLDTAEAPKPEAAPAPETAKVESPKIEPPQSEPAKAEPATAESSPSTPAAIRPPAAETPVVEAPKKQEQAWKDPPPDEAKRKVRVIDGATVVPGVGDTPAPSAN